MSFLSRRTVLAQLAAGSMLLPTLVHADDKDPYADAKLIDGEPPLPSQGSFTLAVLPDTQHYSEKYPATFLAQTNWIVEQQAHRNIAAVLHLGDITNRNSTGEWLNARQAMKQLDGHLPYCFCPGNHDYSSGGTCKDRTTQLNKYFPLREQKQKPGFGGVYDKEPERMENNYQTFTAAGRNFLVLALEFGPRRDVVRWANDVASRHPRHEIILITHAFIYSDDTRYHWKKYSDKQKWNPHNYPVAKATHDDVTDGEELWELLISQHENFILTLNGHVLNDGLGRYTSTTKAGRAIPQVLVNFQMRPNGGDGWLRLLEFKPDQTVEVYDYSPTRKQRNEGMESRLALKLASI